MPFLAAFTGSESLRTPFNPYVFNIRAGYFDETEAIVRHLSTLGMKRMAVFHKDDANGRAALLGVERALKSRGLSLVASGSVNAMALTWPSGCKAWKVSSPWNPPPANTTSASTSAPCARTCGEFTCWPVPSSSLWR